MYIFKYYNNQTIPSKQIEVELIENSMYAWSNDQPTLFLVVVVSVTSIDMPTHPNTTLKTFVDKIKVSLHCGEQLTLNG